MVMSGETSTMPPPGEDSNSSKLEKLFLDEKLKTSLVIFRIAILNILFGVLLFIALTIGGSESWERSISSMISGYFFSFLMIGVGICMLSVYGINFTRKKNEDNSLGNTQENVWTSLSWRKENKIQEKVLEQRVWFWSLGSLILFFFFRDLLWRNCFFGSRNEQVHKFIAIQKRIIAWIVFFIHSNFSHDFCVSQTTWKKNISHFISSWFISFCWICGIDSHVSKNQQIWLH